MARKRRVTAALAIAVLCAPGTFLRSDTGWAPPETVTLTQIAGASETGVPGWQVAGVWHFEGEGLLFGGFSALVALPDNRLMAFSDRGSRFTFEEPGTGTPEREVARQPLGPRSGGIIDDIEGSARDPDTGTYWLAFENIDAIQRYSADHVPSGIRNLDARALGWSDNSGAEAFTRLSDGRFVIQPEGKRSGLIFAGDPLEAGEADTFAYEPPVPGHGATDMAQLPDGRVLLLLRNVDLAGGYPPFESKIAIGPAPEAGQEEPWAPAITLDLAGVVPRENYEGLAMREEADGRVAVWIIADDNLSILQRTLVVKLVLDPAKVED